MSQHQYYLLTYRHNQSLNPSILMVKFKLNKPLQNFLNNKLI